MDDIKNLAGLEKLAKALAWLTTQPLEGDIGEIETLLTNFYVSCEQPKQADYLNFLKDIKVYGTEDQDKLCTAFFKAYDLPENYFDPKIPKCVPEPSVN